MNEYQGNSHRSKEIEKRETEVKKDIQPVATGRVKKKSEAKKFADTFMAEDVSNVKDYILNDVLLPAVKKAITDVVTTSIEMLLYGDSKPRKRDSFGSSRTSYTSYYQRDRDYERGTRTRARGYDFDDIILDTRRDAEEVLDRMEDLIDTYGVVSVADLYDLVGIDGRYTDNKYGWTRLRDVDIKRVRDGYLLILPKALPLD